MLSRPAPLAAAPGPPDPAPVPAVQGGAQAVDRALGLLAAFGQAAGSMIARPAMAAASSASVIRAGSVEWLMRPAHFASARR